MNILNLCGPVVLYLGFSIIQIIIDIFSEHFNIALLKFIVMIVFSVVLNILCQQNLGIIAWLLVFIPFIFMTVVIALLLTTFGLDPRLGKMDERNIQIENYKKNRAKNIGRSIGDEIADNLSHKYNEISDFDFDKNYSRHQYKKHHHHHHKHNNKKNNNNENHQVGGCQGTRYGCCDDGITSSNVDGSNCHQQNIGNDPNTRGPDNNNKFYNPALDVQASGMKEAKKMYNEEQRRGYSLLN